MDYMSVGSVRDLIEDTQMALTEEQVAFICRESLKGLLYLHGTKIIHRDVKSANILLDADGAVKIGIYQLLLLLLLYIVISCICICFYLCVVFSPLSIY